MKGVIKSKILLIIPLLIVVCFVSYTARAQYGGGTGEPNDPYLIYTAEQLNEIGLHKDDWGKHFKLMGNVDLLDFDGKEGRPPFNMIAPDTNMAKIGFQGTPFTGVFDGNGHTISNFFYINTERDYNIGFFGCVEGENAEIKNLGLVNPNVDVKTANYVGSLVSWLRWGTITNCYVEGGSVLGEDRIGGIVGHNDGTIIDSYTTASVSGERHIGGIVGYNSGTIINCYANSSVMGNGYVGGMVGKNSVKIIDCYANSSVMGDYSVGGMVGYNSGTINNCCASSVVIGNTNVGGMVGSLSSSSSNPWLPDFAPIITIKMSNCYSTSDVSGGDRVGGLAGGQTSDTIITNCYSTGSVSGNEDVGGLVGAVAYPSPGMSLWGITPDTISGFYSTADITGDGGIGQIVIGFIHNVVNSFWDTETSGQHTSAGGIGKTTTEMQTASTFLEARWDFAGEAANGTEDVWWILEGKDYPRLIWELPEGLRLQPLRAFSPNPRDGATDVTQSPILHWAPAEPTLQHDIYLGEDKEEVVNATTLSLGIYRGRQPGELATYDPGKLEWDATYYWRIDEVNEADPNNLCKGSVWCFTTANFLIVDDFESYNELCQERCYRIWDAWIDGFYNPTNGSQVGYTKPPFTEHIIVHGGFRSMPFFYDNSGPANYSETTKTLTDIRDWIEEGIGILSLWFHGDPNNDSEQMYVALNSSSIVYYDNPEALLTEDWIEWIISLQEFVNQGVGLTNINTISIGFGDKSNPQPGGSGLVFFDDIRLYRPTP